MGHVVHSRGYFSWVILMGHSRCSKSGFIFIGQTQGSFLWVKLVGQTRGSFSCVNLSGQTRGLIFWAKFVGYLRLQWVGLRNFRRYYKPFSEMSLWANGKKPRCIKQATLRSFWSSNFKLLPWGYLMHILQLLTMPDALFSKLLSKHMDSIAIAVK